MVYTANQVEKHTIVTRLSVSIYTMPDQHLLDLLTVFEQKVKGAGVDVSESMSALPVKSKTGVQRQMVIARLFILIKQMDKDTLLECLRSCNYTDLRWVREYPRLECLILADFAANGKAYRGVIRDISVGGVYIETSEKLTTEQSVALCFTLDKANQSLPFKILGRITRVYQNGIGIQYENITHYQQEIINTLITKT
jgi:PilZ domain